jgi:lysophospholipase L1-like esterase
VWVTTPNTTSQPDLHLLDDAPATGAPALLASLDLGVDDGDVAAQGARAFVAARTPSHALTVVRAAEASARVADTVGSVAPAVAVTLGPRHVYLAGAAGAPLLQVVDPGEPLAAVADTNGDGIVTVVCLGDSNTMFDHVGGLRRSWCEQLDDAVANPNWHVVNRALLGMTAVDLGRTLGDYTMYVDAPTPHPVTIDATLRLDRADVVILAFGTNDLRPIGEKVATPEQLVAAYQAHVRKLERGGVGLVLVALTPPTVPPSPASDVPRIEAANALLRRTFPADRLLDFWTGMGPEDFGYGTEHDGVHIGPSGQRKRMQSAYRRLVPDA